MPQEFELVKVDVSWRGNGKMRTGTVTDKLVAYRFEIVADEVTPHAFGYIDDPSKADYLERIAERKWEGIVRDLRGAVTLEFQGMDYLKIDKMDKSEVNTRFVVNGQDKGIKNSIRVEPPFPVKEAAIGTAAVAIATGFVGRALDWW